MSFASRQLLLGMRTAVQVQARRGKAVTNWKRPSMDEYLVPTEAYGPANAKRQANYNMFLLGGIVSLVASLAGATILDVWEFNPTPHQLVAEARGTPINDEE